MNSSIAASILCCQRGLTELSVLHGVTRAFCTGIDANEIEIWLVHSTVGIRLCGVLYSTPHAKMVARGILDFTDSDRV
jgi:hypothetical protein